MAGSTQSQSPAPALPLGMQFLDGGALRFALADIPERDRIPGFREVFGRQVLRYDVTPLPEIPFHIDLKFQAIPGLMMMSGRAHGSTNRRTRETLALDNTDDLGMIVNLRGPHRLVHAGKELVLGDNEAALVSLGEVCDYTHRPPGDIVALRVPRKLFAPMVNGVDDCYLRRITCATPGFSLLTSYIRVALEGDTLAGPELQHVVASHVHDLMAMMVGATRDAAEAAQAGGVRAARLAAIKQDIARNLDQPDLSVAALALRHGCTPRFIQRLFDTEGTTFTEYVLAQRLVRAHRLLRDPRRTGDKIATIALDAGFSDVSYFNRAFRQLYGDTPSSIRAARVLN